MRGLSLVAAVLVAAACGAPSGGGSGGGSGGSGGGSTTDGGAGGGAAAGGGAGGGALGGGAGGGATGGGMGGGATGGGSGSGGGVVTFETLAFGEPALVSGGDGVLHLAWVAGPTPDSTVHYARCAQDCGVASSWQQLEVFRGAPWTSRPRLALGPDGRVHLLYELYESSSDQTWYATCASNCTQAASWSRVNLTPVLGNLRAAWRGAPLVVDSAGRASFIVSSLTTGAAIALATCSTGCTTAAGWSVGLIRTGGSRMTMAAHGTTLHLVLQNEVNALVYRTCAADCTNAGSWQESPPLFIHDGYQPTSLAVTSAGGLRLAYNQGPTPANESPAIKAQDQKVLVWSCDANCMQESGWSGVILGDLRDGEEGIMLAERGGALVLALTNTLTVVTRVCTSNCGVDTSWQSGEVDSTTAINAAYDPNVYGMCGTSVPAFSAWYPDDGVVAIRPDGAVAFAHSTHMLRTCAGQSTPSRLPGFGRLVYLP